MNLFDFRNFFCFTGYGTCSKQRRSKQSLDRKFRGICAYSAFCIRYMSETLRESIEFIT